MFFFNHCKELGGAWFVCGLFCLGGTGCLGNIQCGQDADCGQGFTCGEGQCLALVEQGMVTVPAGEFSMGCFMEDEALCNLDEAPRHAVTLAAFLIDRTEVDQAAYAECIQAGVCDPPDASAECRFDPDAHGDWPVACVDWHQANDCCHFAGKRLPTEAEWEKAARGSEGRIYPWGDDTPDCSLANFADCTGGVESVGSHPAGASPFGALDMAGNVWEWTSDWYGQDYYALSPRNNPQGPDGGSEHIMRGGGFGFEPLFLRTTNRGANGTLSRYAPLGFRCAKTLR